SGAPRASRLFPYTTLFRSREHGDEREAGALEEGAERELEVLEHVRGRGLGVGGQREDRSRAERFTHVSTLTPDPRPLIPIHISRSEEHTSELQSRFDLVCR